MKTSIVILGHTFSVQLASQCCCREKRKRKVCWIFCKSMFDILFSDGPIVYKSYLKTEYSDENMEFWLACEKYKKILSQRKRISEAQKLFKEFIQPQAPKEINIDSPVREGITLKIQEPTQCCFDEAQKIVYLHMERDSYPRFLSSQIYQSLIFTLSAQQQSTVCLKEEK
uniref:Regulator of G protein signaling 13 n=1 Tax=Laticauda laticaudata TaxID=8630 RepID=A0A8C5RCG0_LATLA